MRKHESIIAKVFISVLFIFLLGYVVEFGLTKMEMKGYQKVLNEAVSQGYINDQNVSVDYAGLYPFTNSEEVNVSSSNIFTKMSSKLHALTTKADDLANDYVLGKNFWIKLYGYITKALHEDVIYQEAIVYQMDNGYYTYINDPLDVSDNSKAINALAESVEKRGSTFLYVQLPYKSENQGYDYSDLNADNLLAGLNCNTLDLRKDFKGNGMSISEMFYKSDHHWNVEAAFKGANFIGAELAALGVETSLSDYYDFEPVIYENALLGSQGKKVGLGMCDAEDFEVLLPTFVTNFHYVCESRSVDVEGDFKHVMFNYYPIAYAKNYYGTTSIYDSYSHGNPAYTHIENLNSENDTKVLLIRDSFSGIMAPYVALQVGTLDVLDLRYFNGSLEAYLDEHEYDAVVVAYNPSAIVKVSEAHNNFFNFE